MRSFQLCFVAQLLLAGMVAWFAPPVLAADPTPEEALQFLEQLNPTEEDRALCREWISKLGDPAYRVREQATHKLLNMPNWVMSQLAEALESEDAEIRWRAKEVLDSQRGNGDRQLTDALRILSQQPQPDSVATLFKVAPICNEPYLERALVDAVTAAATVDDRDYFVDSLADDNAVIRLASVASLGKILDEKDTQPLVDLLQNKDEQLVVAAAEQLLNRGDRRSLATLVRLLESDHLPHRVRAQLMLRQATGASFGFAAYAPDAERAKPVAEWKDWLASNGETVELQLPLKLTFSARGDLAGNTLIATGSNNKVLELSPSGKEVWSYSINSWGAEKLPNGNRLIASYGSNCIVEVDDAGKVVWDYRPINAMTAKPLFNGNILVADFSGKRAVEITREKKIVWECSVPDNCFDVDRLSNGNTLLGCPNLVREVTPEKKIVRDLRIEGRLNGLQALPNGNILVANYGANKVSELSLEGKEVWKFDESQPCDVFRTAAGETLVSSAQRILEITRDGSVKELMRANYGSARR